MSPRSAAAIFALAALGLTAAQYAVPSWPGFHTWPYAAMLGLALALVAGRLVRHRSAFEDRAGRGLALAVCGASAIGLAGLAAGLLGPDSATITSAPGGVVPIAEAGRAAFFPNVDAAAIARGDATLILRGGRGGERTLPPGARTFAGAAALETRLRPAAYVEAFDARGRRLTVTQPANQTFLSPLLLFPQRVTLERRELPVDRFAVPAAHRQVRALYFTHDALPAAVRASGRDAVLLAVDDDAGGGLRNAIGFAGAGGNTTLGGVRFHLTLGTYPALLVSAIPPAVPVWLGLGAILLGALVAWLPARRIALGPAALLLAALLGSGCTKVGTGSDSSGLHAWTRPDTVRIGLYQEPDSLNPVISSMAFASDVDQLVYDGLIRYDASGTPIPDLAEEVPSVENGGISKDGRTITYHLMPNVRWHDGTPFTAADVIYTWKQIMNPKNNTPTRDGYDRIASIDAPDARTVRVHLDGPYPPAIYLFRDLNQGAIVPKHLLAGSRDINRAAINAAPVGTGPYVFKKWVRGGEMRFDANPSYFRGAPKIPHVVLRFISDQNTLLSQLSAHEIDLYYGVSTTQYDQVKAIEGIKVLQRSTLHWEHIAFNAARPPLDDVNVRRALCYAIDETTLYAKIYHNLGTRGPVHFNPDFPWADRSIAYYPFDPQKAGALLDAAGWKAGEDGVRRRDGRPLEIVLSTVAGVKQREAIEVLLQGWWRAVGVQVSIKNFPAATLFAPYGAGGMLYGGKTEATIFTWQNSTPDPNDITYISPERIPPIGQNVTFYKNADIGRWQRAALQTYDPAKRRAYYVKIQHVLIEQVPEYVFDWLPEIAAVNADLQGVAPAAVGSDLWNIAEWRFARSSP